MLTLTREWARENVERLRQKESLEEHEKIMLSGLQRELIFLDMINLKVDITGKIDEVINRGKQCEIIVLEKGVYEKMFRTNLKMKSIQAIVDSCLE